MDGLVPRKREDPRHLTWNDQYISYITQKTGGKLFPDSYHARIEDALRNIQRLFSHRTGLLDRREHRQAVVIYTIRAVYHGYIQWYDALPKRHHFPEFINLLTDAVHCHFFQWERIMLSSQAVIATLNVSVWNARRYDDKITSEIATAKQTQKSSGRYTKVLMPDEPALKKIKSAVSELRSYHYRHTLPWQWKGGQLLPSKVYMKYTKDMGKLKGDFDKAVSEFIDPDYYQQAVKRAEAKLGGMFRPTDYPPLTQISNEFYVDIDYSPVPSAGDFRVDVQSEELDRLKAAWTNKETEILDAATTHLWEKLSDLMNHAQERLSDPDNVFRNTLPQNIKEFTTLLDGLNIGGDNKLADLGRQAAVLGDIDPDALRSDPGVRADAATKAADLVNQINQQMSAFTK